MCDSVVAAPSAEEGSPNFPEMGLEMNKIQKKYKYKERKKERKKDGSKERKKAVK